MPVPEANDLPVWADLKAIADGQRRVLLVLLAGIVSALILLVVSVQRVAEGRAHKGTPPTEALIIGALAVLIVIFGMMATYRLTLALSKRHLLAVPVAALTLVPQLAIWVVLILSVMATRRLKKHGIKVGFLGTKLAETPPAGFLCRETLENTF